MISEEDLLMTHSRQLYRFQQNQFQELVRLMPDLVLRKALEMNHLQGLNQHQSKRIKSDKESAQRPGKNAQSEQPGGLLEKLPIVSQYQ